MDDAELDRYLLELRAEFIRVVYHSYAKGEVTSESTAPMFELHREQLKAAYTNGYEDHAALAGGVVH